MDNLSELFDIKSIISALTVAAILGIIALIWKKREFLVRKIKNISSFLRLPQAKELILDVYQRIFQSYKKHETKPSLQDYIRSFSQWKSKSETGITLQIIVNNKPEIYNKVTNIRVFRIDSLFSTLDIKYQKPGYVEYDETIIGIRNSEIFRLVRLIYFREIVESEK